MQATQSHGGIPHRLTTLVASLVLVDPVERPHAEKVIDDGIFESKRLPNT